MKVLMIVILIIVAVCVIIYIWARILEKKREAEILKAKKDSYRSFIARFDKKYGVCSEIIKSPIEYEHDILRVYKESEVLVLNEKALRFADIVSSRIELDAASMVSFAPSAETTTVDMKSLIKRSAVGAVVGGNVGMVLGGLTAKRKTTTETVYPNTPSLYCLIIETTLNQHPTKKFMFYDNIELARQVNMTINRIVKTYKQEKKDLSQDN